MNELLAKIIDAHGGMERWNGHEKVDATIVSGGGLFPLKGVPQDSNPRRMTVSLHEERSSVLPYGALAFDAHNRLVDIVRLENGRLAEHWDVIEDEATRETSVSGLPMFGPAFPLE